MPDPIPNIPNIPVQASELVSCASCGNTLGYTVNQRLELLFNPPPTDCPNHGATLLGDALVHVQPLPNPPPR